MIYAEPNKIYTLEEYLELDFLTDAKYEFFDGELVEISGVHYNHALINGNVLGLLHEHKTEKLQSWIGSMKLFVPDLPPYRYPNFSVSPRKAFFKDVGKHQCLVNPILIGEIHSPETKEYDWGEKFEAYKSIKSFTEYVLIDQNQMLVNVHTKYDKDIWFESEYKQGENVKLESINCEMSIDEIYLRIEFEN